MTLSDAIIALAKIAVDQRREIAALRDQVAELAPRVQAAEAAAMITLPDALAADLAAGEGGTVAPPAIL